MSSTEIEAFFDRMADGKLDYANNIKVMEERGQGLGRLAHGERKYLLSGEMVGGGAVTISPVQQGIQQARQLSRMNKRSRSSSRAHSATRRAKRRRTTGGGASSKKKTKKKKKNKTRKTARKSKKSRKRSPKGKKNRRRDALGWTSSR